MKRMSAAEAAATPESWAEFLAADPDRKPETIACHEAGHAIAGLLCGGPFRPRKVAGLEISLNFDDDMQVQGDPRLYSLHLYFDEAVETRIFTWTPSTLIDNDCIRYFLLRNLAGDGCPTGIVAGMPCRAERLESGSWLLLLWAEDAGDLQTHVLNDCRGAV
jgi:hypothetical protein